MGGPSPRRAVLVAFASGSAALAGCVSEDGGDGGDGDDGGDGGDDGDDTGGNDGGAETEGDDSGSGDEETEGQTSGELDLREANVVGVELEAVDGGTRFSVTLHHDDDGEDGYANRWVVESLDGEELGRRDLAHAHGTQEFTRSTTVELPADAACVVVRGHDQTHEYGGRAALVDVESGDATFVDQGAEPQSFTDTDCP